MNQQAYEALVKERVRLIMNHPFFGELSCKLQLTETASIPTLATNGKKLFYNPDWVLSKPNDIRLSGIAHEIFHCIYDHMGRLQGRDPRKWNFATDYAINYELVGCGFKIEPSWLYDTQYAGMSADHIYSLLPDPPPGGGGGKTRSGVEDGDAFDEVMASEGDDGDAEKQRIEWQVAVAQAALKAREQGKLPASLERFINELLGGQVDWRAVLWDFVQERVKDDFSWVRPNKVKLALYNTYIPTLYNESMGKLVVIGDTSGSIDSVVLSAFAAEIEAIRSTVRPSSTVVIWADAAVQHVQEFSPDELLKLEPRGGGGTDFRPAFKYIDEHQVEPVCAIYLTDMYGSFPDVPPPFPVLWCATTDQKAPWGDTVRIKI